jgi:hypothetical protein
MSADTHLITHALKFISKTTEFKIHGICHHYAITELLTRRTFPTLTSSHDGFTPTDGRNRPVTMLRSTGAPLRFDNSTALDIRRRHQPTGAPMGRRGAGLPHCPLHTDEQKSHQWPRFKTADFQNCLFELVLGNSVL